MNAYIFNADIFCEECTQELRTELGNEGKPDTGDSDDFPQGPYSDGGGESDCPEHCGDCGVFLENSLTTDGENYVKVSVDVGYGGVAESEWKPFYSYLF